jgi:hypothetical protein
MGMLLLISSDGATSDVVNLMSARNIVLSMAYFCDYQELCL